MYILKAFIGKKENLISIAKVFNSSQLVDLDYGISMIPMTDELFNEMNNSSQSDSISIFEYLNCHIETAILNIIKNKEIVYAESEFFGGDGGHIGIIWKNNKRVYLGEFGKDTMNVILRKIGVEKEFSKDEFDTVGLGMNRSTESWLQ